MPQRKHYFLVLFLTLAAQSLVAQYTPLLSLSRYNWVSINPAVIEKSYIFNEKKPVLIQLAHRQPIAAIEDGPSLSFASVEIKPKVTLRQEAKGGFKAGIAFSNDKIGGFNKFGIAGNFSRFFHLGNETYLHLGISATFFSQQLDITKDDFKVPETKVILLQNEQALSGNLGIFYRYQNKFYTGISSPQLIHFNTTRGNRDFTNLPKERSFYWLIGGFVNLNRSKDESIIFEPTLMLRYTPHLLFQDFFINNPISGDLNLRFHFQHTFSLGIGYSTNKYLQSEVGIRLGDAPTVTFELAYQIPTGGQLRNLGQILEARCIIAIPSNN